jgi:hypothetical protein
MFIQVAKERANMHNKEEKVLLAALRIASRITTEVLGLVGRISPIVTTSQSIVRSSCKKANIFATKFSLDIGMKSIKLLVGKEFYACQISQKRQMIPFHKAIGAGSVHAISITSGSRNKHNFYAHVY